MRKNLLLFGNHFYAPQSGNHIGLNNPISKTYSIVNQKLQKKLGGVLFLINMMIMVLLMPLGVNAQAPADENFDDDALFDITSNNFNNDGLNYQIVGTTTYRAATYNQTFNLSEGGATDYALQLDKNAVGGMSSITISASDGSSFKLAGMSMDILSDTDVQFTSNDGGNFSLGPNDGLYVLHQNYDFTLQPGFNNITSFTISGTNMVADIDDLNFESAVGGVSQPEVTTSLISSITATGATLSGNVTDDGGDPVTERGFVYALTVDDSTPTVAESSGADVTKVVVSGTTGVFNETISGLSASSQYSFAAYAINSVDTSYGSVEQFSTINNPISEYSSGTNTLSDTRFFGLQFTTPNTDPAYSMTGFTFLDNTGSTPAGAGKVYVFTSSPSGLLTPSDLPSYTDDLLGVSDTWNGSVYGFSGGLNLDANTTYWVLTDTDGFEVGNDFSNPNNAIYATSSGNNYVNQLQRINYQVTGIAVSAPPTVTTTAISTFDASSATMGGDVTADGGATVTERGVVYNTTGTPTTSDTKVSIGTGTGSFSQSVSSLSASTTYYVRAYAINSEGTSYGSEESFTTSCSMTASITSQTNVSCNGDSDGGLTSSASGGTAPYFYSWDNNQQFTGDLTSGGTPSASSSVGLYEPEDAFDNASTIWRSANQNNNWLKYDFGAGNEKTIKRYQVQNGNYTGPNSWKFQASNDNSNWTDLDTVSSQSWSGGQTKTFFVINNTNYRYYRLGDLDFNPQGASSYDIREFKMYEEISTPSLSGVGAGIYTVNVTDANGCTALASDTVEVSDATAPIAVCQNRTIQLDTNGQATITAAQIDNGSTDNCSIDTMYLSQYDFDCSDIGTQTVTLTVADANGNTETCTATITVEDNTAPIASCKNITVQLDANGNAGISASDVDDGSSDNCAIDTMYLSQTDFDCSHAGANTVTLSVTDVNGNTSTCTSTVTVEDNTAPVAVAKDTLDVYLDASGNASITASDVDSASSDNCSIQNMGIDRSTFDCSDINAAGEYDGQTVLSFDGNDDYVDIVTPAVPQANNYSFSAWVKSTPFTGSIFGWGGSGISNYSYLSIFSGKLRYYAGDGNGSVQSVNGNASSVGDGNWHHVAVTHSSSGTVTLYVDGNLDATGTVSKYVNNPTNTSIGAAYANGIYQSQFTGDIDNLSVWSKVLNQSDIQSLLCSGPSPQPGLEAYYNFEDGTGSSVLTDLSGNGHNGSLSNMDVNNDWVAFGSPVMNPICQAELFTVLTVEDAAGNISTDTTAVQVHDTITPNVDARDITVYLDATGNVSIVPADVENTSSDACGIDSLSVSQSAFDCNDIGSNTVTLTATDVNGNSANATATVTVADTTKPSIICPADLVSCQPVVNGIAPVTNDNCGIASITYALSGATTGSGINDASGTTFNAGVTTVKYIVTDNSGNIDSCSFDIEVLEIGLTINVDSNVICTGGNDGGLTAIASGGKRPYTYNWSNGSSDSSITGLSEGIYTVTVTDDEGCFTIESDTLIQGDLVIPTALCQNKTIYLDAAGQAELTPAEVDNGSYDNCGIDSMYLNQNTFGCADLGSNNIVLTVVDLDGNGGACNSNVTVLDTVSPSVSCKNVTIYLDANGDAFVSPSMLNGGLSDNCSVTNLSIDKNRFTCVNIGPNTVTLTVEDQSGNTTSCSATVTVLDTLAPVLVCQNISVNLDQNGVASIQAFDVIDANASSENCTVSNVSLDISNFTCADIGQNTVNVTIEDSMGNTATCSAIVTIYDSLAPVMTCKNITVQLDANGDASIVASDLDDGSIDNCAIDSLGIDQSDFDCSHLGANTVLLTAIDNEGNSATCSATVTVEDTIDPVAACQPMTIYLDANGIANVTASDLDDGSTDNCAIDRFELNISQFDCNDVGINNVVFTAIDISQNKDECNTTITVVDTVSPTVVCQDIAVQLDANGMASILTADIDNGSADICGIDTMYLSQYDFDCADVGQNTVTLTVEDVNGNVSTCTATVTVEDNVAPTALCQNLTVQLDVNGAGSILTTDIDNGSSDNCGIDTMYLSQYDFDCSEVGQNIVTLTVKDVNGNVSTCTATVTVEDNVAPTALCQNLTVQLDANGVGSILTTDIDNGSSDNCGIDTMYLSQYDFDCSEVGQNTVTLTVEDFNGNVSTCTATVTVEDNVAPTALCQNLTVQLDVNGAGSILTADIDNGSTDNCGIDTMYLSQYDFDCAEVGQNTVTLTVEDFNGNVSTCTATVTVEDNVAPTALCQNLTVQLDANGAGSILTTDIDNGSSDNCGIDTMYLSQYDFDCADVGQNTVTLTVEDVNGNVSTCTATLTVEDTVAPTALCQDISVYLNSSGTAGIAASQIDNGSTDACGVASVSINKTQFGCANRGANTVTLTVEDVNGNISTCNATVTVIDTINPGLSTSNVTVYLDANGSAVIDSSDVIASSADLCGIQSYSLSQQNFDCNSPGFNDVIVTVTDSSGNSVSDTAVVEVIDTVRPTISANDISIYLPASGSITVNASGFGVVANDNCGVDTIFTSQSTFTCADLDTNKVVLAALDLSGNMAFDTVNLVLIDTIAPQITNCPADIEVCAQSADGAIVSYGAVSASDNCGSVTQTLLSGLADGEEFPIGTTTVSYEVSDAFGNTATCSFDVTVLSAPIFGLGNDTLICKGDTLNIGLPAVPGNIAQFEWSTNATVSSIPVMSAGLYSVTVTDTSGCSVADEIAVSVKICPEKPDTVINSVTSIARDEIQFNVFPNPTTGLVNIQLEGNASIEQLQLFNINGKTLQQRSMQPIENITQLQIDISEYATGVYLLQLKSSNGQLSYHKVILDR